MPRSWPCAAAMITLLALAGCAGSDPGTGDASASRQPRRCFSPREARNFTAVNSNTVHVRAGRDVYRIETMGICSDLNWTNRMALVSRGSSMICVGSGLGTSIVTRGPTGRQRCQVRSIIGLTPEQVAALPARERP